MSLIPFTIPFGLRKQKLLSFSIRALDLDLDNYKLEVINYSKSIKVYSNESKLSIIPYFPLDNSNKELKDYFYNQKFSIHSINLLNSEGKIIYSFEVDLSELKLLDTSLKNIKIYTYPFLFIEFTHGFYTTKELYLNNLAYYENFFFENNEKIFYAKSKIDLSYKNDFIQNDGNELKNKLSKSLTNINKNNKNLEKNSIKIKKNFTKKDENENNLNNINLDENNENEENNNNINDFVNNNINEYKINDYNSLFTKIISKKLGIQIENKYKELKNNINLYKLKIISEKAMKIKENFDLKEKIKKLQEKKNELIKINENLEEILNIKQKNNELSEAINIIQSNFEKKKNKYINKYNKKIGKYNLILNALIYKKFAEISYIFFNKKIKDLYYIPNFYDKSISEKIRHNYYANYTKLFASMMGHISLLINYFSQIFNINFKYPFLLFGSKCYIINSKKEYNPLFSDPKNENRFEKFENSLEILKYNLLSIFNYLEQFNLIFSNEENDKILKDYQKYNFFYFFIKLNNAFYKFIKNSSLNN